VYVDGVPATERTPFADTGGDYVIDYEAGTVTFSASQSGKVITADYSYQNGSTFYIIPDAGKKLWIEKSEAQFTVDTIMNDTMIYQPFAINPGDPGGPKVPADIGHVYKKVQDLIQEANGVFPEISPFGGVKRGLQANQVNMPFDFGTIRELKSSWGVEIRIWLETNSAFGGEFSSVTLYCMSYTDA
jgi:hypothetical protein